MGTRIKKYTNLEISAMLDSNSESEDLEVVDLVACNTSIKRNHKLHITVDSIHEDSTDSDQIFDHLKTPTLRRKMMDNDKVKLRIKLRRSTEQSMYKIDTDSDYDKPKRKVYNSTSKIPKRSTSRASSKEKAYSSKKKENDLSVVPTQDENQTPPKRSTRTRKPPLRYVMEYSDSPVRSSITRPKKLVNYKEDKFDTSSTESLQNIKSKDHHPNNASQMQSENNVLRSRTNKRNHSIPDKEPESESGRLSKVIKTRTSRKLSVTENKEINSTDNERSTKKPLTAENKDTHKIVATPKLNRQERTSNMDMLFVNKENDSSSKDKSSGSKEKDLSDICQDTQELSITKAKKTPRKKKNSTVDTELSVEGIQLATPKSRSGIKCSKLTPSIDKRTSVLMKPMTPLQEARSKLHVSVVPKSLPCREEEFNNIFTFLEGKLKDKSGGCMYISGVPGTGKTATVNEVIRCLKRSVVKGQLDSFDYVDINGMKLSEPRQSYVQILKQLTGQNATWEQAYDALDKRFCKNNSKMTLLLVDELDLLCTKRQDVVYNLLDWPTKASAQLVVITIANTMDLPERVLMGRVTSRLGLTRLTFQPYNHKQLQEIVHTRLKEFNAFRSEAIQLVARKIAAVSGDARRALDICRRSTEIVEQRQAEIVTIQDVNQAISEMIAMPKVQAIKHCSKMEQVFLEAVCAECERTGIEEVYFKNVYKQLEALCSFEGIKIPTITEVLAVCGRLGASRLLICEHSRADIYQKLLLNISTDDVYYALERTDDK
ncbi:hypothetical protein KM043_001079 [Ampulex compressa]|nr:hypothetical protein KM043_001079 [Ampulex compressa]